MSLRLRSSIASRDDATRALRRLSAVRAVKDDERRRFSAALEALGLGGAATLSPATSRPSAARAAIARPARSDADGRAPVAELALRGERAAPCDAAVAVAAPEPPAGDGKEPGAGDGDDLPEGAAPRAVQRYRRYLAHAALLDDACARYGDGAGVVGRDALPKALKFLVAETGPPRGVSRRDADRVLDDVAAGRPGLDKSELLSAVASFHRRRAVDALAEVVESRRASAACAIS
ncbi:hypothetical protein SO694_00041267 [Aureococcus anophagefferens]|uniref:Uncharacterized protein n=1 Tax=Aureococcus anophagefferens TaxID=44056 RepID=A0ABR1G777_AURAN